MQRMRADFVHAQLADARQHRKADGADAGVELGDPRTLRNLGAHVIDDALRDLEIVLPERARRVVHGAPPKCSTTLVGPAARSEVRAENRVGALAIGVEPQAVQLAPSRSRIRSKHAAKGSAVSLLPTITTCAVCELRSTTTCR